MLFLATEKKCTLSTLLFVPNAEFATPFVNSTQL